MNKRFECDECKSKFSWKSALRLHKKSQHEQITYDCDQCDYRINYKSKLNEHIKTTHEGFRHCCDICNWKCLTREGLRQHIKSTHGEESFIKAELKQRIKNEIKTENRKVCPVCCKKFKTYQLQQHLDRHLQKKVLRRY